MKQNRLTDTENEVVAAKGVGDGGGMKREVGVSRCKLLHTDCISNKAYCIAQGTCSISQDKP